LRLEQFGQTHNLRPTRGRIADADEGLAEVFFRFWAARHLNQRNDELLRRHETFLQNLSLEDLSSE
jgi:hypothetical protein